MASQIPRERLEEQRDRDLKAAEIWKSKGRLDWSSNLVWAAQHDLQIAVCFYPGVSEAVRYLQTRHAVSFLDELAGYCEASREESLSRSLPVGNDVIRFCLFACVCWLMEADEVGRRWIRLGLHPAARVMLDRFDIAFMDSHAALPDRTPYSLPEAKKWRRWEKHLLRYAALAAAITRGEDVTPYIEEIRKHFEHRNRTYGLTENYDLLDGCKLCPASFDIRLEGILAYARRHYDIALDAGGC